MVKYKGKKLEGLNTDLIVFKKNGENVVLKAQALQNYKEFDKVCPEPQPPMLMRPGGIKEPNIKDKNYQDALQQYGLKKTNYTIIKSLQITEDLEWETVNINDPETYDNWRKEFEDSGFTEIEILRILQLCSRVNCLDDSMMDEAKESFLAEARQQEK